MRLTELVLTPTPCEKSNMFPSNKRHCSFEYGIDVWDSNVTHTHTCSQSDELEKRTTEIDFHIRMLV